MLYPMLLTNEDKDCIAAYYDADFKKFDIEMLIGTNRAQFTVLRG
jgi:hypothetical protein